MSIHNRFVTGMIVLAAAMLWCGTARAQSYWTNTASGLPKWSTDANWTNGTPSSSVSTILNFSVPGTYTSSNDWTGIFTNNGLVFGAGTVTLVGGTNAFMNNGATMPVVTNYGATVTNYNVLILGTNVTFAGASNTVVPSVIRGTGGLTKTGTGRLKLGSTATSYALYTGLTYVLGGTLVVDAGNGAYPLPSGATVYLGDTSGSDYATFQVGDKDAKNTFNGNIFVQSGNTGTSKISLMPFSSDNGITLAGTVTLGTAGLAGHDVLIYADYNNFGVTISAVIQDAVGATSYGTVTFQGAAGKNTYLFGNSTYQGATVIADANTRLYIGNSGPYNGNTTSGRLGSGSIANNGLLFFARTDTYGGPVGNAISGSGSVSVNSGALTFTGTNTYSGSTTISNGATLYVGNGGTTGTIGTNSVTDHGTLVFNRTDSYGGVVSNTISGTGTVTLASGLLTLSGTNTYTGVTTLSGGFMTVSNNLGMSTNRVVLAGGGISVPGEALTLTNAVTVSSASSLNAVGNLTLLGALTNSGALTKTGAGTLTLVASSPYSGLLTVSNGTLTLNGSIAGSVTIAAGGTLNGTGAVAGAVSNYGTISPADATTNGTLTVSNMVMGANSTYVWNCNNTTNDVIVVNGSLTLPNVATVTVNQATGRLPNPGVLFTGFSSVNTSNLTGWVVSGAMGNTRAKVDGNQVVLVSPRGCVLYVE